MEVLHAVLAAFVQLLLALHNSLQNMEDASGAEEVGAGIVKGKGFEMKFSRSRIVQKVSTIQIHLRFYKSASSTSDAHQAFRRLQQG